MGINLKDMLPNLFGQKTRRRKMRVAEALDYLVQEEEQKLIDMEQVTRVALERVESSGIIFLDEIDAVRSLPFSTRNRCASGAPLPPFGPPAPKVQNATTAPIVASTTNRRLAMFTPLGTPTSQLSSAFPLPVCMAPPSVRLQG